MATSNITSASETKEWVLACNQFEECEIESLKNDVSFIESELIPPTDPKETNSMYFLENVPRDFRGDGVSSLWVFIDIKSKLRKRPPSKTTNIAGVEVDPLVDSIPVTETFHHLGHEGKVFIHSDRHNNITTNLDILIRVPAGDAARQVHMRFNYTANVEVGVLDVDVKLYKDTIVSVDGTSEPIMSTNDANVKTSGILMFEGSTITDVGILKTQVMIAGEKKSASSKEQAVPEWILAPDGENERNYLLRATVNGGAADIVNAIFFYDTGAS